MTEYALWEVNNVDSVHHGDLKMKRVLICFLIFAIAMAIASCVTTGSIDWDMLFKRELPPDVVSLAKTGIPWLDGALAVSSFANGLWRDLWGMKRADDQQNTLFAREDSAVTRRVADLKAAGLSPTLAAGSAANSSVVSMPNLNGGQIADAVNTAGAVQQIRNARQENANMKKSQDVMDSQINLNNASAALKLEQTNKAIAEGRFIENQILQVAQNIAESKQRIEESQERTKGYKYSAERDYSTSQVNYWKAANEMLDNSLILQTGLRSTVGSLAGTITKGLMQTLNNAMRAFKQEPIHSDARLFRSDFQW